MAETSDSVFGFVFGGRLGHWTSETDAYIGELVVSTSSERQGVATVLVAAVEQWAADQGYRRLMLETGAANEGNGVLRRARQPDGAGRAQQGDPGALTAMTRASSP